MTLHTVEGSPTDRSLSVRRQPTWSLYARGGAQLTVMMLCTLSLLTPTVADADARRLFAVSVPVVDLEFIYESEDETVANQSGVRDEESEAVWTRLRLASSGWIYHPALLEFEFDFHPEWKNENIIATDGFERDEENTFLGYTFDATLLRDKPYTLRLFSSQTRDELNSSLVSSTVTDARVSRAELHLKNRFVPLKVSVQDSRSEVDGFYSTLDSTRSVRIDANHEEGSSRTVLRSGYVEQDRSVNGSSSSVDRLQTSIANSFRPARDARLFSTFFGSSTSSQGFDTDVLTASERLLLEHRTNLRSEYELRLERQERDDFSSDLIRASGGLVHELYENLVSSLDLQLDDIATTDGDIGIYDADLHFSYRRGLPFGRISARAGMGYRVEDNEIATDVSQVIDERVTLTVTAPSFLRRPNVEPTSLVVTSIEGAIVYQESFDYVVIVVGTSTGIERTPLGGIPDGQTVLVDYRFVPRQAFKAGRQRIGFGSTLDLWELASFDYQLDRAEEKLLAGTLPDDLVDDTRQRLLAELRWRWSRTRLEYEDRDTTRTPLKRWRAHQTLDFQPMKRLSLSAALDISETDFEETDDRTDSQAINVRLRWRMARWGLLEVKTFDRKVRGTSQKLDDTGFFGRFQWWFGAWYGSILYETLSQDEMFVEQIRDRDRVLIQLTRRFG